jgi:hypothetical protein
MSDSEKINHLMAGQKDKWASLVKTLDRIETIYPDESADRLVLPYTNRPKLAPISWKLTF